MSTKLAKWKLTAHTRARVHLANGVDVTTPPSAVRASFPYEILPPMRTLRTEDILRELVKLPPVRVTGLVSFAFGAICCRLLSSFANELTASSSLGLRFRYTRLLMLLVLLGLYYRFLKRREPTVTSVSHSMNVSSNPAGPCCVTTRVLTLSNSHAGTHADTPQHFLTPEVARAYDDDQYTGDAVLLDLSQLLVEQNARGATANANAITAEVLREAMKLYGIELSKVTRLLVCSTNPHIKGAATKASGGAGGDVWRNDFAHLTVDGADFLAENGEQLLLFGFDTPSVDHPNASPISRTAHGKLWAGQIAILENLDFRHLHHLLAADDGRRCFYGAVQTVFNPYQAFADSRGCSVIFYPPQEPGLSSNSYEMSFHESCQ